MTGFEWAILLFAAIAGTCLSAIFSGMEIGLYTLNRVRLELRSKAGERSAHILHQLLSRPSHMLTVILIGTNAANQLGAWSISAMLDGAGYGPIASIVIDTIILVPVLLILAEVLPKELFRAHGDRWCYSLAPPLRVVELILRWTGVGATIEWLGRGIAAIVGGSTEGEVTARQRMSDLFKEGIDAGLLSEQQTNLLDRALSLRDRTVQDEMVPWEAVQTVTNHAPADDRRIAINSRWSRLPVTENGAGVTGIVSVLDLDCSPHLSVGDLAHKAMFIHSATPADHALRKLRIHHAGIGVVQDDQGETIGIVTIKDLIRPLLA
jgi:CBS domain containing-hemolysin-like protein